jgi:hypothetical protein
VHVVYVDGQQHIAGTRVASWSFTSTPRAPADNRHVASPWRVLQTTAAARFGIILDALSGINHTSVQLLSTGPDATP